MQTKLLRFLQAYRSTLHTTTGVTPAELFLKRAIHTRLDLLHPSVEEQVANKQADQKRNRDMQSKDRQFNVGQTVLARNLRGEPKWLLGRILEKTGPVSYRVQVQGQIWRRHADQLLDHGVSEQRSFPVGGGGGSFTCAPRQSTSGQESGSPDIEPEAEPDDPEDPNPSISPE